MASADHLDLVILGSGSTAAAAGAWIEPGQSPGVEELPGAALPTEQSGGRRR